MDQEVSNSLRQAVNLLKTGDAASARKILVEILRTNPDVEQAWYMLSFAVPNLERQIYALQQTLKLNPGNEKAKARLSKLGGKPETPIAPAKKDLFTPTSESKPSSLLDKKEPLQQPAIEPGEDLLSQRLFGSQEEAKEEALVVSEESAPIETPGLALEAEAKKDNGEISEKGRDRKGRKVKKEKKEKKEKKGISRRVLLLLVLIAIFGGGALMDATGSIDISSIIGRGEGTDGERTDGLTETPTEVLPTFTQTITVPSSTPTSALIIPTTTSVSTPVGSGITLFSVADLSEPSEEIKIVLATLQDEISSIRQLESETAISSYFVYESTLQRLMGGFSRYPGYYSLINNLRKTYEALGLVDASDDLSSLFANMWVDPNGVFFIPDSSSVVISGSTLTGVEKYTYARGYAQALIGEMFDFEAGGFFPVCEVSEQQCDVFIALLKGDATLTANLWLEEFTSGEEKSIIEGMTEKLIFLPITSPPSFIDPQLSFPYDQGLAFVEALYSSGGWEEVNSAYLNLPTTTEQILHPNKYLSGESGVDVEAPALGDVLGEEWDQIFSEPLGEWKTFQIMAYGISIVSTVEIDDAQRAAAGWGGDFAQVYTSKDGLQTVLAVHWVWDSKGEADEFMRIFGDHLEALNASDDINDYPSGTCWEAMLGDTECLFQMGSDTYWFKIPGSVSLLSILELYSIDTGE